jgi:hypothetical protein
METINLSFGKIKKTAEKLPKTVLVYYNKIPVADVFVKNSYRFALPVMRKTADWEYFFLQSYKGYLDMTDRRYIIHYGNQGLADFKIPIHHKFYGKIVNVVIFEYENYVNYGILYENEIYYTDNYNKNFIDIASVLTSIKFKMYYRLNEIKTGDFYYDKHEYIFKKLKVDLNKMYYLVCSWIKTEDTGITEFDYYLKISEYDANFLKEFYVDEKRTKVISEIHL